MGSCKNAKLYGNRKLLQYRIKASDDKKICSKNVNIKFQSAKDHVTTFKDSFKCCRTRLSEELLLARNTDTGKYILKQLTIIYSKNSNSYNLDLLQMKTEKGV